jgi:hypothetical protein
MGFNCWQLYLLSFNWTLHLSLHRITVQHWQKCQYFLGSVIAAIADNDILFLRSKLAANFAHFFLQLSCSLYKLAVAKCAVFLSSITFLFLLSCSLFSLFLNFPFYGRLSSFSLNFSLISYFVMRKFNIF